MRFGCLALVGALLPALPAVAQDWRDYAYPAAGFAVYFPAPPTLANGLYKTAAGTTVPAAIYTSRQDNVDYTVTVADFSKVAEADDKAIADAVKAYRAVGEIKVDVEARINRQYGHELSVVAKDGSLSIVGIFFFDHHLYALAGKAQGPDSAAASSSLIRFQQSLQFPPRDGG